MAKHLRSQILLRLFDDGYSATGLDEFGKAGDRKRGDSNSHVNRLGVA